MTQGGLPRVVRCITATVKVVTLLVNGYIAKRKHSVPSSSKGYHSRTPEEKSLLLPFSKWATIKGKNLLPGEKAFFLLRAKGLHFNRKEFAHRGITVSFKRVAPHPHPFQSDLPQRCFQSH